VGGSKAHTAPHSTVLFGAQVIAGGVVSLMVTVWLQVAVPPQASVARHVRVAVKVPPQVPALVTVLTIVTFTG
jgi:hypothetical protein